MNEEKAAATVAPVVTIKTATSYGIFPWLIAVLLLALSLWLFWNKAGDVRAAEVIAKYDKLAIEDASKKLTDGKKAEETFAETKVETKIKYINKTKEIIKYVETPEGKQAAVDCKLNDNFIRLYNSEGSSDSQ
jgi:hypothetical protein